ncbi:MAG: hypothetical protein CL943_00930 [Candidatus Diapherotrites archaeon]|uniref:DNA primase large subunit PriL n=1 Tax=Candidatus Iainarchaeum sp. TaxID=3101447 RepID=A0A2D6M098_9ARCH|nr:hypothetical protein [Candidatus Diapherotrites archaeon]|tara:strand:+ start:1648 stop:2676 length:1029 start_codon:yes stop_codon:yes gene_type:complete
MPSLEQLQFAQKFPFSPLAKRILKESNLSLETIDEETMNRAAVMISRAFKGKEYTLEIKTTDLLEQEIAAFPIAKILVSLLDDRSFYKRFALMVARSTFSYLESSQERKQLALDLAEGLDINFSMLEKNDFFVSVPLTQFLSIKFNDKNLKLVNQHVESGTVFLNTNSFLRFLSEIVFVRILSDLPVPTGAVPKSFRAFAKQISIDAKKAQTREFNFKVEGKMNPNAFPPCMASLYQKIISGERLPHMARFFLATFLNAIGMPQDQIISVFKKSPDFDQKIAGYQIRRIAEQNYALASCEKIKSYGVCTSIECRIKHPLSYYKRMLRELNRNNQTKTIRPNK